MIPVLKVNLPPAEALNHLIKEIDRSSIYSNFGPQSQKLSQKIEQALGLEENSVLLTSSGTSALQAALLHYIYELKKKEPDREIRIAVPAWTFPATIQSVLSLGIRPILIDVDQDGYMSKEEIDEYISHGNRVDIVVPVIPFGSSKKEEEWDEYSIKTGIKVVIDAAASIFTLKPTKSIAAVSLHVTKGISSGEGGFLVSSDQRLISNLRGRINFGFSSSRIASVVGINGKMSEYNAAVGLHQYKIS